MEGIISKKNILILVVVLVLAAAVFYSLKYRNGKTGNPTPDFSNQISGQIKKTNGNVITISGVVKSSRPGGGRSENRTIDFTITTGTIFKKITLTAPSNLKPGETFKPVLKEGPGSVADLIKGVAVIRLQSKEDLFTANQATALDINYEIFGF